MTRLALNITPMSYGVEQRVDAIARAAEWGYGVCMEVGNTTTRFYADDEVAPGQMAVYAPKEYKGLLEYVETLEHPEEPWEAPWDVARRAAFEAAALERQEKLARALYNLHPYFPQHAPTKEIPTGAARAPRPVAWEDLHQNRRDKLLADAAALIAAGVTIQ